jgi:uncharacterized protein
VKYPLLGLLKLYQWLISPLFGPTCRFYPSCSRYAYEAIATHGAVKGCYLAARRLLRCHPWNPGGLDPVPPRKGVSDPGGAAQTSSTNMSGAGEASRASTTAQGA